MKFGNGLLMLEKELNYEMKKSIRWNNVVTCFDTKIRHLFHTDFSFYNFIFMSRLPDLAETQRIIIDYVEGLQPFVFVRFGLYEYMLCYQYLEKKCDLRKQYSDFVRRHISIDAGIFDNSEKTLDQYSELVLRNLSTVDVMSYWRNIPPDKVFGRFYASDVKRINVDFLYPFPFLHKELPNWQSTLEGKNVLIVSSFAKTIKNQYEKRKLIWKNEMILPEFNLIPYESVQTSGRNVDLRFKTWEEAFLHMRNQILEMEFDVALISCGAYGMPLAIEIKKSGHKAIQWGGCSQLWFGILGGRWDKNPNILKYANQEWKYPSEEETPPLASAIDGSCYWKPVEQNRDS